MATISSNAMAVYAFTGAEPDGYWIVDSDRTVPLGVMRKTASTTFDTSNLSAYGPAAVGRWKLVELIDGAADYGPYVLLNEDNTFEEIVYLQTAGGSLWHVISYDIEFLELIALATSSSLEASNSIGETSARDGAGNSVKYITSGATAWSISVDGLLDVAANSGSSVDLMDTAREKNYVVVKYQADSVSYAGQALIDSISLSGGVDDIATYSASLGGYADLYKVA